MSEPHPESAKNTVLRNAGQTIHAITESKALQDYLHAATSDNTRKAYRSAIRQFEKWGGRLPTDQQTVIRYLLAKAEMLNTRTLDLHLTAIAQWHRFQGLRNPVDEPMVSKAMEGYGVRMGNLREKPRPCAWNISHRWLGIFAGCQNVKNVLGT